MSGVNQLRLSQLLTQALRHVPGEFGLVLDAQGWAQLSDVIAAVGRAGLEGVGESTVRDLVAHQSKKRLEISGGRIRAAYGHSFSTVVDHNVISTPPSVLFHATSPQAWQRIREEGLKPMGRQFVHLATSAEQAMIVGLRHADHPVLLRVDTACAAARGVQFMNGSDSVILADAVPTECISAEF
ncbi:RNA 2'-phosphotransferase [Pseudoclavibacter sp. CFCC 13611]|uniref:RNA 2'-phosphotransferase n=2 Tax=unclassified Pseudoclavibacter TaxID=2615177 RepID=UPI0013012775|nr:RNA 2'-phosphotransferase [Pseudoclavibacter sp. CFCC 13611]KAB1663620.1 RNA 2'-phosphotransferase [Pseudoclavibacter sp. CFCC 13611]